MTNGAGRWFGVIAICALAGCGDADRAVDPDGREEIHAHGGVQSSIDRLQEIQLKEVVGAAGAVSVRDAAPLLERWLVASGSAGEALLARWARTADGQLDLDRAPLRIVSAEAAISPGGKSRCGDVSIVFGGASPTALRLRLAVPGTFAGCRNAFRAIRLHDGEALDAIKAAIADARVPIDDPLLPVIAAN